MMKEISSVCRTSRKRRKKEMMCADLMVQNNETERIILSTDGIFKHSKLLKIPDIFSTLKKLFFCVFISIKQIVFGDKGKVENHRVKLIGRSRLSNW
jgi:hypothetical protein